MTPETLKHWKRRALKAEEELATLKRIREFESTLVMGHVRENSRMEVAFKEAMEALQWGMEKEV